MAAEQKIFRVLVTGVSGGQRMNVQDLLQAISHRYPLAADARIALELGRSAVVTQVDSVVGARKVATQLVKLGAEVRIEPDPAGVSGGASAGGLEYGEVELSPADDRLDLVLSDPGRNRDAPPRWVDPPDTVVTAPPRPPEPPSGREDRPIVDRPPRREPAATVKDTPPSDDDVTPPPVVLPGSERPSRPPATPSEPLTGQGSDSGPGGAKRAELIRCPAHGLLYDATRSEGCSRCLVGAGPTPEPHRVAWLGARPRLKWTLGLVIGLSLGAVPAAWYAQRQQAGPLLHKRVEAEAIRRGRIASERPEKAFSEARQSIRSTRSRAIALSAVLWVAVCAIWLLVWLKLL